MACTISVFSVMDLCLNCYSLGQVLLTCPVNSEKKLYVKSVKYDWKLENLLELCCEIPECPERFWIRTCWNRQHLTEWIYIFMITVPADCKCYRHKKKILESYVQNQKGWEAQKVKYIVKSKVGCVPSWLLALLCSYACAVSSPVILPQDICILTIHTIQLWY